jgi:hypothetical protein
MLWRMTLQRRRGKSPLAMESINGRYCRSPRERDAVARNVTSRMALEADAFVLQRLLSRVESPNRQSMPSRLAQLVPRDSRTSPERSSYMAYENGKKRAGHCGSFMTCMNNSNAFSQSNAATNRSFCARNNSKMSRRRSPSADPLLFCRPRGDFHAHCWADSR